jgi:hypothetical protein
MDGEGLRVGHGGSTAYSLDRLDRDADRQRSKNAVWASAATASIFAWPNG